MQFMLTSNSILYQVANREGVKLHQSKTDQLHLQVFKKSISEMQEILYDPDFHFEEIPRDFLRLLSNDFSWIIRSLSKYKGPDADLVKTIKGQLENAYVEVLVADSLFDSTIESDGTLRLRNKITALLKLREYIDSVNNYFSFVVF